MRAPTTILLLTFLISSCSSVDAPSFDASAAHVAQGDHDAAISALEVAFRAGASSTDVLRLPEFGPLLSDDEFRPRVRELVTQYVTSSTISMVRDNEPGEPMVLTIRVVSFAGDPAPAGVVVGIVHVDADGYYQPSGEEESWNPRLFGAAVTDETGSVTVRTIRPGHYGEKYEAPDEPAHVHYDVTQNGRLLRAAEFFFEGDERLTDEVREEARGQRTPIATVRRNPDGSWHVEVVIAVGGLR